MTQAEKYDRDIRARVAATVGGNPTVQLGLLGVNAAARAALPTPPVEQLRLDLTK